MPEYFPETLNTNVTFLPHSSIRSIQSSDLKPALTYLRYAVELRKLDGEIDYVITWLMAERSRDSMEPTGDEDNGAAEQQKLFLVETRRLFRWFLVAIAQNSRYLRTDEAVSDLRQRLEDKQSTDDHPIFYNEKKLGLPVLIVSLDENFITRFSKLIQLTPRNQQGLVPNSPDYPTDTKRFAVQCFEDMLRTCHEAMMWNGFMSDQAVLEILVGNPHIPGTQQWNDIFELNDFDGINQSNMMLSNMSMSLIVKGLKFNGNVSENLTLFKALRYRIVEHWNQWTGYSGTMLTGGLDNLHI